MGHELERQGETIKNFSNKVSSETRDSLAELLSQALLWVQSQNVTNSNQSFQKETNFFYCTLFMIDISNIKHFFETL